MCSIGECLIKYTLIVGNVVFAIAGLAILGLGIAAHVSLTQLSDLTPINLTAISISIIVLGCVIFLIAFLACCGAIIKAAWMLVCYSISLAILAGLKIWLVVVMFSFLSDAQSTVADWLYDAFDNLNLRPAFVVMETLFQCCGTDGPSSYDNSTIPASCCPNPIDNQCLEADSFGGCNDVVSSWFDSFGAATGGIIIGIIVFEVLFMVFGFHVCYSIRKDRKARVTV